MHQKTPNKPHYIPVLGYPHFYRSLLQYMSIPPDEAFELVFNLYIGNLDTCVGADVRIVSPELDAPSFARLIFHTQARPYYTPVQLYRAMEDIFRNVRPPYLIEDSKQALRQLHNLSDALALRFEQIYGVDISAPGTCYSKCRSRLSSYSEEPIYSMIS